MELISGEYREQNRLLHESPTKYGQRGHRHLSAVRDIMAKYECKTILDYGCGTGELSKHADFHVQNYDPAIPQYSNLPNPADLVVCTDVMEHIEIDYLGSVLNHISNLAKKAVYFVIATRYDRSKNVPDGSNPHKIVENGLWWERKLSEYFKVVEHEEKSGEVVFLCVR